MKVDICGTVYEIRIQRAPLCASDGTEVAALAVEYERAIYLSSDLSREERAEYLAHELVHPLAWATAEPRTEEDAARLARTAFRIVRALDQERLRSLPVLRWTIQWSAPVRELVYVDADAPEADPQAAPDSFTPVCRPVVQVEQWRSTTKPLSPAGMPATMIQRRYCPGCDRPVHPSEIVDERKEDPTFGPVLFRTMHCDCIKGLYHWFEPATAGWKPAPETGSLEPAPRKTTDPAAVEAWMKQHASSVSIE